MRGYYGVAFVEACPYNSMRVFRREATRESQSQVQVLRSKRKFEILILCYYA